MRTVVVGTDGSAAAGEAVMWAAREARAREARLVVVHAWSVPAMAYNVTSLTLLPDRNHYQSAAEGVLERTVARIDADAVPLGVESVLAQGMAADVLVEAGRDAELLVVGSTGRSPVGQLLLGSVSQAVLRMATVPVVVIPAHQRVAA